MRAFVFVTDPESNVEQGFEVKSRKILMAAVEQIFQDRPEQVWNGHLTGGMRTLNQGETESLLKMEKEPKSEAEASVAERFDEHVAGKSIEETAPSDSHPYIPGQLISEISPQKPEPGAPEKEKLSKLCEAHDPAPTIAAASDRKGTAKQ